MTEKLLCGHHIKNLSIALNFGRLTRDNRIYFAYIINSEPNEAIRVVANEEDGCCEQCKIHDSKEYEKCHDPYCQHIKNFDQDLAEIWECEVGQVYSAKDLISKVGSTRSCFMGLAKTAWYIIKRDL